MHVRGNLRPFLAALLAVVQPGLGHLYLRKWVRATLWFGLWVGTVIIVLPVPNLTASTAGVAETLAAALNAMEGASIATRLTLLVVTTFSAVDAYWLAVKDRAAPDAVTRCPNCGKEVDESIDFCHWCTEQLSGERSA